MDGVVRQALRTKLLDHSVRDHGACRTVNISDLSLHFGPDALLERELQFGEELRVKRLLEVMVLSRVVAAFHRIRLRLIEDAGKINPVRLPAVDVRFLFEEVREANQVLKLPDPEARHNLADFLSDEEEVVHDMTGVPVETLTEFRILSRDADRARVQVALTHHEAAFNDERSRRETELIGTEHRADHHVAARLDLAVHLDRHAVTEVVKHEGLLGLRETELPGAAGVLH